MTDWCSYEEPLSPEEIARLCQADGEWEDDYGRGHYWSCGAPAVACMVDTRRQVCGEHLDELIDSD